jgi:transposase
VAAVQAIQEPWRATDETPWVSVADTGISNDANMQDVIHAGLPWISRVSDTSTQPTQALAARSET